MELLDKLAAPDKEFTPIPFWFLNGDLTAGELRRQLTDFSAHGVYGVVLHPRMGLAKRIGYLSQTYFYYIKAAVSTAAELGMKIVLYDEGMYPSGSACGQVVAGRPELASEGLALVKAALPTDELLAKTPEGCLVARKSGGTLRGVHWGEDDGEPNAPASADILNPEAVERFIALTHEAYYRELKKWFGNVIIGFFTDEPSILGRNAPAGMVPWTRGFAADFTAVGGNLANLAALFSGQENADTALYRKMILRRENETYYARLSAWCESHGIALMGHPHQSDDIEPEKYFHVPGQDLVFRFVSPENGGLEGIDAAMGKCSADAARLAGRRRNSNECFGACNFDGNPWQFTGADMKWYIDWLAVRGVNLFIPHAFYYSIKGKRKDERPPDVGPNSIWWQDYKLWAGYMSRMSCLMTDAELITHVAVLCRNRDLKPELTAELFRRQISFQYLPESAWPRCREQNGGLLCGNMRFDTVFGAKEMFPAVPHGDKNGLDAVAPDCVCVPPQPWLRCAHFKRAGRECWLLVNEGADTLQTAITLPVSGPVGQYDLWRAKAAQAAATGSFALTLHRRESLLLFACTPEEYAALPPKRAEMALPLPEFKLVGEDAAQTQKIYEAGLDFDTQLADGQDAVLEIEAEEMAKLYVNGVAAGVSFWPTHRFVLTDYLRRGKNSLRLVVTGSRANLYGNLPVPYGLKTEA